MLGLNAKRKDADSGNWRFAVTQGCCGDKWAVRLLREALEDPGFLRAPCCLPVALSEGDQGLSEEQAVQARGQPCPDVPASGQAVPSNLVLQQIHFTLQRTFLCVHTAENRNTEQRDASCSRSTRTMLPVKIVLGRFPSRPFLFLKNKIKQLTCHRPGYDLSASHTCPLAPRSGPGRPREADTAV